MKRIICACCVSASLISCNANASIDNFREAKLQMVKIFKQLDEPKTIYCGCSIEFPKRGYMPNLESCGYEVRTTEKRAKRIEAEHIMPAWEFGHDRQCWIDGKRKGCEKDDTEFQKIEGDLHNLYPAIGEVNADRSNFKFTDAYDSKKLSGKSQINSYGQCTMKIDRKRQRANPPERARGIIARAYLYMSETYNIKLDAEHINLFNKWNKQYKPDKNECTRNILIKNVQGNDNRFVTKACKL